MATSSHAGAMDGAFKPLQWDNACMEQASTVLNIRSVPIELQRGLRMLAARRYTTVRDVTLGVLYAALDAELADWPQWRYQTEPGEELELVKDGRRKRKGSKKAKPAPEPE